MINNWKLPSFLIVKLLAEPNIMEEVIAQRLRWTGHLEEMEDDRVAKMAYFGVLNRSNTARKTP